MIILPHSTALELPRQAWVTYAVAVLCILIYATQCWNNLAIEKAASHWCSIAMQSGVETDPLDYLMFDREYCEAVLPAVRKHPDFSHELALIRSELEVAGKLSNDEIEKAMVFVIGHYQSFAENAPWSLNARIIYDPASWNPLTMITANLAHGDFWHLFFNLVFFLAFAPAMEVLLENSTKWIVFILMVSWIGGISYSLYSLIGDPLPTLGLSCVVTAMIGLSTYLMPWVRIKTLVLMPFPPFVLRQLRIPAWILAGFYIGGDIWQMASQGMAGGTNLVSHIAGGISGYFLGALLYRYRKTEIQCTVSDLIEEDKNWRINKMRRSTPSLSLGPPRIKPSPEVLRQRQHNQWLDWMYSLVETRHSSEALLRVMQRSNARHWALSDYESLFWDCIDWPDSHLGLCMGRYCVDRHLQQETLGSALSILMRCQQIDPGFELADPRHLSKVAGYAFESGEYTATRRLVTDVQSRWGDYIDTSDCAKLEARLLLMQGSEEDITHAREIISSLLEHSGLDTQDELYQLKKWMTLDSIATQR